MKRRNLLAGGVAAGFGMAAFGAHPARAEAGNLKFIYPYSPGEAGDTLLRVIADDVGHKLGLNPVVENHTGADGRIGVRDVKMADPDGNTVLFTPFGAMTLFPSYFASLPYDAFKDFTPVTQAATFDFGLAVGPMTPAKNLAELVDWMKQHPNDCNVAIPGLGALPHLLPLKFATLAGVKLQAIAYKGAVPSLTEAMAGHVPMACTPIADQIEQHRAGTIRILASSGQARSPFAPDIPTFLEQGFDVRGSAWYGAFVPAKTPAPVVARLNALMVAAIRSDVGQETAKKLKLKPTGTTAAELGAIQRADFELWAPVFQADGLHGN